MFDTGASGVSAEAVERAILRQQRGFQYAIEVDWDRDGLYENELSLISEFVSELSIDRALTGAAPEALLLIEGSSVARLTFTLAGDFGGLPMMSVFSPYNGNSPLYNMNIIGAACIAWIGVETDEGIAWYNQFQGYIRTITPNRADGSVTITALDRTEDLRKPVRFPGYAVSSYWNTQDKVDAQLINSQAVIDACLRQNDFSPTGIRPIYDHEVDPGGIADDVYSGIQFWLSAAGGVCPVYGWVDNNTNPISQSWPTDGTPMFEQVGINLDGGEDWPQLLALSALGGGAGVENRYWATEPLALNPHGRHWLGFTMNLAGDTFYQTAGGYLPLQVRISSGCLLQIEIDNGRIRTGFRSPAAWSPNDTQTFNVPVRNQNTSWVDIPAGIDHIQVTASWDTTSQAGMRAVVVLADAITGDLLTSDTMESIGTGVNFSLEWDELRGLIGVRHRISMSDIFYQHEFYFGGDADIDRVWRDARNPASLDVGKNYLSHLPTTRGEDGWNIITAVAAAEYGVVFIDEHGWFVFWNYDRMVEKRELVVRSYTLDEVSGFQVTNSLDSVRNIFSAKTRSRVAVRDTIYESQDPDEFYLRPGQSKFFEVWPSEGVLFTEPWELPRFHSSNWDDSINHGYCYERFIGGSWQELPPGAQYELHVRPYLGPSGQLIIQMFNGHGEPVRCVNRATDSPALRVAGSLALDHGETLTTVAFQDSIVTYGARNLELSGSWYQDNAAARQMLETLGARTVKPIPTTDGIEVAGDPRIQLGDTIEVRDEDGIGERARLQIYGIRRTLSDDGGLRDQYTVEMIEPPGSGLWDSPQFGRWDETFVWSP